MKEEAGFYTWIEETVNTYRVQHGLPVITKEEADQCLKILSDFHRSQEKEYAGETS